MRLLWCVTGAGHWLRECACLFQDLSDDADVAFSRAGVEVARQYSAYKMFAGSARMTHLEEGQGWSSPLCAKVASGAYRLVVVAPASANTVAKLRAGIADSLLTNVASQAVKAGISVVLLPTDVAASAETELPSGKKAVVHPRAVDVENSAALSREPGFSVAGDPAGLAALITAARRD